MIPKIIHQSFIDRESIKKVFTYEYCQKKLLELHPDFEYRFYSDSDMEIVMKENFPDYYENWTSLPKHMMKVDMFRYFIMYLYGGIYCDLDYLFLKKFDLFDKRCIIHEECAFKSGIKTNFDTCCIKILYSNCIFSSEPKHPFWRFLMDDLENIKKRTDEGEMGVIKSTGPIFLTKQYEKFEDKGSIFVTDLPSFNPKESFYLRGIANNNKNHLENKIGRVLEKLDERTYGIHLSSTTWINSRRKVFKLD